MASITRSFLHVFDQFNNLFLSNKIQRNKQYECSSKYKYEMCKKGHRHRKIPVVRCSAAICIAGVGEVRQL